MVLVFMLPMVVAQPQPYEASLIEVTASQILVNKEPYFMQAVGYSPVPIGGSAVYAWPYGDYCQNGFKALWDRDLPKMVAMGVNTLRIYGWTSGADHDEFFDACQRHGIRVIITYFLGTALVNPVDTAEHQDHVFANFTREVVRTGAHPAILAWTLGNEINGPWNLFIGQLNEKDSCNDDAECYIESLFDFIDEGAKRAKAGLVKSLLDSGVPADQVSTPFMVTSLADVHNEDLLLQRIASRTNKTFPNIDVWGFQLYRGKSFGDWLDAYQLWATKPGLITEYGVDAFSDPCGPEKDKRACNGTTVDNAAMYGDQYGVNEGLHDEWNMQLTSHLFWHKGVPQSKICGGSILAWVDEWWKGAMLVEAVESNENDTDSCGTRTGIPAGRMHVECPAPSSWESNVCGYWLDASFDQYVNEAWFGIHAPAQNTSADYDPLSNPDILTPRKLYYSLQALWTSTPSPPSSSAGKTTTEQAAGVDLGTAIGFGVGAFFAGACVSAIYFVVHSRRQAQSRHRLYEDGSVHLVDSASFE